MGKMKELATMIEEGKRLAESAGVGSLFDDLRATVDRYRQSNQRLEEENDELHERIRLLEHENNLLKNDGVMISEDDHKLLEFIKTHLPYTVKEIHDSLMEQGN